MRIHWKKEYGTMTVNGQRRMESGNQKKLITLETGTYVAIITNVVMVLSFVVKPGRLYLTVMQTRKLKLDFLMLIYISGILRW